MLRAGKGWKGLERAGKGWKGRKSLFIDADQFKDQVALQIALFLVAAHAVSTGAGA
jgi:hypothetical protein